MVQKHISERILTDLKEKAPLYAGEEGLTKKQKKKYTSMSFFPKISYWRPLVSNAEM